MICQQKNIFLAQLEDTSLFPGGLETFLRQSVEGQILLQNKQKGILDTNGRQKICNIIISHLLLNNEK
jgi:hypothetical protein